MNRTCGSSSHRRRDATVDTTGERDATDARCRRLASTQPRRRLHSNWWKRKENWCTAGAASEPERVVPTAMLHYFNRRRRRSDVDGNDVRRRNERNTRYTVAWQRSCKGLRGTEKVVAVHGTEMKISYSSLNLRLNICAESWKLFSTLSVAMWTGLSSHLHKEECFRGQYINLTDGSEIHSEKRTTEVWVCILSSAFSF